jgi:nicotinate phosphoribosyltransferase
MTDARSSAPSGSPARRAGPWPDPNDPGLLSPDEVSLLVDQYELTMAASYLEHGRNEPAVFELFVRRLPARRRWLLVAGLGPTLSLVQALRFGDDQLAYLATLGLPRDFLGYLSTFEFRGDIHAMPEGTIAFANEPVLRVTAPRIEAQLLETLLLNQINFQTMLATKAARVVLAAGGGGRLIDFSPRRDHGTDAAMKAARSSAIAGFDGTSNVAAAMRYGLHPVGTMAHSYVMSFTSELEAFETFMQDFPNNAVMLVDTYDTLDGVRHAIEASRSTGVPLGGVRLDSGDLLALATGARALLDAAGMQSTEVFASGDLEEGRIAELVAAGAPIDAWGVGTDLGTSRDSPTVNGVYKLVADRPDGGWRGVWKDSPGKATVPGAKQVHRGYADGTMRGDLIAMDDEECAGEPLLVPVMREGEPLVRESLAQMRERAAAQLAALPEPLRILDPLADVPPYPVSWSPRCRMPAGGAMAAGLRE